RGERNADPEGLVGNVPSQKRGMTGIALDGFAQLRRQLFKQRRIALTSDKAGTIEVAYNLHIKASSSFQQATTQAAHDGIEPGLMKITHWPMAGGRLPQHSWEEGLPILPENKVVTNENRGGASGDFEEG